MAKSGHHELLDARLHAVAARIAALQQSMAKVRGVEKLEALGEIEELEGRHQKLAGELRELEREGPGFRQQVKADLEAMADDLACTVEAFMTRLDADYAARHKPTPTRKP